MQHSTMSDPTRSKGMPILPHEWCFGLFLAQAGIRLFVKGGMATVWSVLFLACLVGGVYVILWAANKPTPLRWRIRLLYFPAAMGLTFYSMRWAVPLLGIPKVDEMLLEWDRALIGETPAVAWESWLHPSFMDVAMLGYIFFFFYLVIGPAYYCIRDLTLFRKCIVGLFVMYGIGFIGYTIFPAGGPHRWMEFETPLRGPWVLDWTLKSVNDGSNTVDVFPSIHFSAMFYLLWFDWKHHRGWFWRALLPVLVCWFATLYLRFHYLVDLIAGLVVAFIACAVAQWYEHSDLAQRVEREQLPPRKKVVQNLSDVEEILPKEVQS
jgi:membrane-associated phospholipid phosphatase